MDFPSPGCGRPLLAARLDTLLGNNVTYWKGLIADQQTWDTDPAPPTIKRLQEIQAPALLIVGTADVGDIQQIVDTLEMKIAGLTIVRIPQAGHLPNMERPAAFLSTVEAFLGAHPQ